MKKHFNTPLCDWGYNLIPFIRFFSFLNFLLALHYFLFPLLLWHMLSSGAVAWTWSQSYFFLNSRAYFLLPVNSFVFSSLVRWFGSHSSSPWIFPPSLSFWDPFVAHFLNLCPCKTIILGCIQSGKRKQLCEYCSPRIEIFLFDFSVFHFIF